MIDVLFDGWGNLGAPNMKAMQLFTPDPIRAMSMAPQARFRKCSAYKVFNLNTFTVFSPFSVHYKFDREKKSVSHHGDNIMGKYDFYDDGTIELQTMPQYMFRAKESVLMQQLPPLMQLPVHPSYVVPGEFDISKWYRPINSTFVIPAGINELNIREGDPLFSLRFVTKDNEPVKLIRKGLDQHEIDLTMACTAVTSVRDSGNRLPQLYEYFERLKRAWKPSKCPFRR
jgi:hypothetical protein